MKNGGIRGTFRAGQYGVPPANPGSAPVFENDKIVIEQVTRTALFSYAKSVSLAPYTDADVFYLITLKGRDLTPGSRVLLAVLLRDGGTAIFKNLRDGGEYISFEEFLSLLGRYQVPEETISLFKHGGSMEKKSILDLFAEKKTRIAQEKPELEEEFEEPSGEDKITDDDVEDIGEELDVETEDEKAGGEEVAEDIAADIVEDLSDLAERYEVSPSTILEILEGLITEEETKDELLDEVGKEVTSRRKRASRQNRK